MRSTRYIHTAGWVVNIVKLKFVGWGNGGLVDIKLGCGRVMMVMKVVGCLGYVGKWEKRYIMVFI